MTVLHLLGSAAQGGAETYFVELVRALDQPAAVRVPRGLANEKRFGFGGPLDVFTRPRVAAHARELGATVLTAWMNRAARHTPAGNWARIGRLGGYYDLKYYCGFDALVGNTADIRNWIVAQGWPAERAHYLPNFAQAGAEPPLDRSSEDTPEDVPLLLGMGRLHASKAHDVSLRALSLLPEAWLWIAGAGPLEAELRALAESLGVAERVRFLGWRTDAAALYRAADVCVFPSRYEPLGNVVIQAWAHGLPVVAAASQGPSALIRDGENGRLVPVDDPVALAEAVRELLASPAERVRLATAGRDRVRADFSKAAVVAQWRALFAQYGA